MPENKVFGPLTFKQFIYLLLILGISFYLYKNFEMGVSGPLIVLMIGTFIFRIINSPKIIIDEEYLKRKKENTKAEEFERWIKNAKTNIELQIELRKNKGAIPDPKLEKMNDVLERFSSQSRE